MGESEAMRLTANACYPWKYSCRPFVQDHYQTDSQDKINRCCNCTKAECNNCIDPAREEKRSEKKLFKAFISQGLSQREITERMHITDYVFRIYMRLYGHG